MGLMGTNRFGMPSASVAPQAGGAPSAPASWTGNLGSAPGFVAGGLMGSSPRAYQAQRASMGTTSSDTGNGGMSMGGGSRLGTTSDVAYHNGGVASGGTAAPQYNSVQQAQQQGPGLADIQAEQQRRNVGAQLNANPQNSALAGYMMG